MTTAMALAPRPIGFAVFAPSKKPKKGPNSMVCALISSISFATKQNGGFPRKSAPGAMSWNWPLPISAKAKQTCPKTITIRSLRHSPWKWPGFTKNPQIRPATKGKISLPGRDFGCAV